MSDTKNELELYIAEKLKEIDPEARPTRGSGCGVEIGDISSKYFFIECKMKRTKANIIVDYYKDWLTLTTRMPLDTKKIPLVATENKWGDKFITMEAHDFFKLVEEAKNEK